MKSRLYVKLPMIADKAVIGHPGAKNAGISMID